MRIAVLLLLASCTRTIEETPPELSDAGVVEGQERPWDLPVGTQYGRWMKCMLRSDFDASGMAPAWNAVVTSTATCASCHENASEGFIISADATKFFDAISTNKYLALDFFTTGQPFAIRVNEAHFNSVSSGQLPHADHPQFDPTPAYPATVDFIARTTARYDAHLCGD